VSINLRKIPNLKSHENLFSYSQVTPITQGAGRMDEVNLIGALQGSGWGVGDLAENIQCLSSVTDQDIMV
jgi:hypothetical protein